MKLAAPLAALLTAAGCASVSARLDQLGRDHDTRCVVYEPTFTLCSPFDVERTAKFTVLVREQDALLRALFDFAPARPWIVTLELVQPRAAPTATDEAGQRTISFDLAPSTDVHGYARGRELAVRVVDAQRIEGPDGASLTLITTPTNYATTVRHELAHAYATAGGWSGASWLGEGLAHLIEYSPVVEDRLVLALSPQILDALAAVPHDARELPAVLDLREDVSAIVAGRAKPAVRERLLATSLVAFLFERAGASDVAATAVRLARTPRSEIEALAPAWEAWLDERLRARSGAASVAH